MLALSNLLSPLRCSSAATHRFYTNEAWRNHNHYYNQENFDPGAYTLSPFLESAEGGDFGVRRSWELKEDKEALELSVDMPGFNKDDVDVLASMNRIVIKAYNGDAESRRYKRCLLLPEGVYETNKIKAEIENGLLKVVVPKIKDEEKSKGSF